MYNGSVVGALGAARTGEEIMQLTIRPKKVRHHSACSLYGKIAAKGCYECVLIREREAARRTRVPLPAQNLLGDR